jgi:hypothetical protein
LLSLSKAATGATEALPASRSFMKPSARTFTAGFFSAAIWPAVVLTSIFGVVSFLPFGVMR